MRRDGFLRELRPGGDPVLAALHLAAEDDALSTKSTVELPVAAYSKRVDALVAELPERALAEGAQGDPAAACEAVTAALFGPMGFTVAAKPLELYSPYRIYMHKVLAQRCGSPAALAVVLAGVILRAQAAGLLPQFEVEAGLTELGTLPSARPRGHDAARGSAASRIRCGCDAALSPVPVSPPPSPSLLMSHCAWHHCCARLVQ
jgi:Transglutaminase-like superfamily